MAQRSYRPCVLCGWCLLLHRGVVRPHEADHRSPGTAANPPGYPLQTTGWDMTTRLQVPVAPPRTADAVADLIASAVTADDRVRSAVQAPTIYRDRVALQMELSTGQRWRIHVLDSPQTLTEDGCC